MNKLSEHNDAKIRISDIVKEMLITRNLTHSKQQIYIVVTHTHTRIKFTQNEIEKRQNTSS
jgi:hypothetical protein